MSQDYEARVLPRETAIVSDSSRPTLLAVRDEEASSLSIRAKALTFADPTSQEILNQLERVAPSEAPILILGETGTGKELVARHAHHLSGRSGPFLAVNCAAISEHLAESEFFGHEANAFTGANARREGWFEAAHNGTLFLDENGDLPLSLQVKLLRVLQEREVVRIGARKPIPINVRLIAATNIDLKDAVAAGRFRLDLFYRINIAELVLPPLRERRGDILPLAQHFLGVYSKRLKLSQPKLSEEAREALLRHSWSGNIRELENVIHFALLVSDTEIRPNHLKLVSSEVGPSGLPIEDLSSRAPVQVIRTALQGLFDAPNPHLFDELEHIVVEEAYRHSDQNQVHTAALLGISRNILRTLLKKHGFLAPSAASDVDGSPAT